MHQSTTQSLLQTFWPRWTSRHFLTLAVVQTLLPVTFAYSLSPELSLWDNCGGERGCDEGHWHSHTRGLAWAFQKLLERYNKCITAGGDYFKGNLSFIYALLIKVTYEKSLETYRMRLVYVFGWEVFQRKHKKHIFFFLVFIVTE